MDRSRYFFSPYFVVAIPIVACHLHIVQLQIHTGPANLEESSEKNPKVQFLVSYLHLYTMPVNLPQKEAKKSKSCTRPYFAPCSAHFNLHCFRIYHSCCFFFILRKRSTGASVLTYFFAKSNGCELTEMVLTMTMILNQSNRKLCIRSRC